MTDRANLRAQALDSLRREVPDDLEWLPWRALPRMRWRDDGTPIEELVPRGWLVAAARRGDPEPDHDQRKQAALFDRGSAAALAGWLLRAWMEHDTTVPELTHARRAELRAIAERAARLAARFGRGGGDCPERYRQLLAQEENRSAPSALPHQGLLAVVAACADDAVMADVRRYLWAWHAERPAQCCSLLRMLSWIESPAARALLFAACGFPSIRGAAEESIANRRHRRRGDGDGTEGADGNGAC